jgi:hypothetical protein
MRERLPLRRAQPADARAMRALTRAACASSVPHIGREPKPMTADYQLYTNSAFEANLQFYARRGCQEFQRVAVAPGNVAVHMRKRIN